jgi:hypothetical protein
MVQSTIFWKRTLAKRNISDKLKFPSSLLGWSGAESIIAEAITDLLYQPRMMMDDDQCEQWVEWENRSTREKTCPSAAMSTSNLKMTWSVLEPGPPRWEAGDYPPELCHGYKAKLNAVWTTRHLPLVYMKTFLPISFSPFLFLASLHLLLLRST